MGSKPIVGIITNEAVGFNGRQRLHSAGKRYVDAVMNFANVVPILIPACIKKSDVGPLLDMLDGVVLTGGRANIEPHNYGGQAFPDDEVIDPDRDKTVLGIIPECVQRHIPIFGICRGIQEINVAYGGTIFYRVHQQNDKEDHRMPQNDDASLEEIFKPRHQVMFTENSLFKEFLEQDTFRVNSLHGQGIDQLGAGLTAEAYSPDGLIEAISISDYKSFAVAIQWHAEFHPERDENYLNKLLFQKFGDSCQQFHAAKS
ncbi:gamma-glutamyl-gamma-aminobutyrate hydrolase family protein [Alphaproteobacteria bacterium]|nr:gamma-glutamyl-gamma-aminobutyrate hydrolase family protein [Alphaproteobacteria bacterium]